MATLSGLFMPVCLSWYCFVVLLDLHTQVFLSVILIRSCHFNLKKVLSLKCLPFETFYWLLLNKQYKCLEILTLKTKKKTYFVQPWRAWVKLWYNDTRWRKLIFLWNTCQVKENVNLIIIYQFKKICKSDSDCIMLFINSCE